MADFVSGYEALLDELQVDTAMNKEDMEDKLNELEEDLVDNESAIADHIISINDEYITKIDELRQEMLALLN